jgi:hypothetical protein
METLIPPAMQAILAAPPLVPGEDEADYQRMVAQLGAESGAATTFDWFMVKDVADLTWQIARTRRWVSAYAVSGRGDGPAGAAEHMTGDAPPISRGEAIRVVGSMYDDGEDGEFRALMARLAASPQPNGPAHAHAFFRNLASLAKAEQLLMRLEYRRDRAIAQIEARRQAFGSALRAAANRVVDADAVEPRLIGGPPLAPPLAAAKADLSLREA